MGLGVKFNLITYCVWYRCLVLSTCLCTSGRATVLLLICTQRPWGTRFMMWRLSIMPMVRMLTTWGSNWRGRRYIHHSIIITTTTMAVVVVLGKPRGMLKPDCVCNPLPPPHYFCQFLKCLCCENYQNFVDQFDIDKMVICCRIMLCYLLYAYLVMFTILSLYNVNFYYFIF